LISSLSESDVSGESGVSADFEVSGEPEESEASEDLVGYGDGA